MINGKMLGTQSQENRKETDMATASSQTVNDLLEAGFSRFTLAAVSNQSLAGISAARMEQLEFPQDVQDKLDGLLRWTRAMKETGDFNVNPSPYYESQMVVLHIDGGKQYTALHQLYESGLLTDAEMMCLTLRFSNLYDYNAFVDEFPTQADFKHGNDGVPSVVVHHGLPEIEYDEIKQKEKVRQAIITLLKEECNAYQDRISRRLAS